ncbi:MAG: LytR C-terminal domain-containing protein [bacterium]|nr:LytR C-terminal domain-containing protein [bacterium]
MPKAAPKKKAEKPTSRKPHKNTGRPVRAAVQAARAAALRKFETEERGNEKQEEVVINETVQASMSSSPRHVVVETGDMSVDVSESPKPPEDSTEDTQESGEESEATEMIAAQNVAEAITTENPGEYAVVRKNVSSSRLFFVALGTGIFLGALIFGGLILFDMYGGDIKTPFFSTSPSPSPSEEPSPSPTEVVVDPAGFSVQVLNGTGVPGAAGNAEDVLSTAGFSKTSTGNASEYGFTDTEVAMKGDVPDALFSKIKTTLSGYNVVQVTSLPSDGQYDVVITVGTKSGQ